jgi:multidrug efflux pump subunit AcrB
MWIVKLALRRPYTFIVVAILLLIVGPLMLVRTPTDIFPNIDIPVVSVVWSYNGLSAQDMAQRITTIYERALTSDVDNVEHIESQSLNSVSVVKIFFHPGADINRAIAQASSNSESLLKSMPPGTLPPIILTYNASTVPILQLALSSAQLTEQELFDYGNNFIRTQLATVQGSAVPIPYGGKVRQVMVDIDSAALQAKGLSPSDVVNAVNAQNLVLPGGTAKIGTFEYNVNMNGSPQTIEELNGLPIKSGPNGTIYIRDVATVHDGYAPQTNMVRVDGNRSALLQIEKSGSASTLAIIGQVKQLLPRIEAGLPRSLQVRIASDQSVFVTSAVSGVIREGLIAACLTGAMILLFLGSWRSTLIIAITIPLSILASLTALSALGESINIMTLGGLALAVGILVDDATVAIENIAHKLELGQPLEQAILDASGEIALPTLVSTLSICIVFAPMFLLPGVARYLFVPLAEAVVFAMLASYFFSRTLVPTLALYLLRARGGSAAALNRFQRFQHAFEAGFSSLRDRYQRLLEFALERPRRLMLLAAVGCVVCASFVPFLGRDFFPTIDSGEIRLHFRAKTGTRIEQTARLADEIEQHIRSTIPSTELAGIVDNIGLPVSGINISYDSALPIGAADADVMVTLKARHRPTAQYVKTLRSSLAQAFPGVTFAFLPADMVSQILNFGLPAPIDIQIVGNSLDQNRAFADKLLAQLRSVPGLVDLRIQQPADQPEIDVNVDRTKALQAGFTQREVAQNLLIALSGSSQTSPNFWLNPKNGVSYPLMTETPQYQVNSLQALANIPLTRPPLAAGMRAEAAGAMGSSAGLASDSLGSLGIMSRTTQQAVVSHYNVQPVIDVFASVQGRDLGGAASDVQKVVSQAQKELPTGSFVVVRGQVQTMKSSFTGLYVGLALAIVLVYLLMVINFQSWLDPLIAISGMPMVLSGVALMLFLSQTTLSVPALTGAMMSIGIATANSILVVSFARDGLASGLSAREAAQQAGVERFRPVVMTALAMLIGMVPMAIGMGDGGEQNAPLGRAVIGGLIVGTFATLLIVPAAFSLIHGWRSVRSRVSGGRLAAQLSG